MKKSKRAPAAAAIPESSPAPADVPAASKPDHGFTHRLLSPLGVGVLEAFTLVYVSAPILIFIAGWLRPVFVAVMFPLVVATLAWGAYRAIVWHRDNVKTEDLPEYAEPGGVLDRRAGILVALVAFLVACTGAGRLTYQFADYWLYDAHLRELMTYAWPPGVIVDAPEPNMEMPMATYWGYWLPASVVGMAAGWNIAYLFQYVWNVVGVLLTVIWFLRIVGVFKLRYAVLFLFFGGLDIIGYVLTTALPSQQGVSWFDYLTGTYWWSIGRGWMSHWSANYSLLTLHGKSETGGVFFRFYGPLAFLCDGPQHVLPAWVITLTVLHDALRRKTIERLFFLTSSLPLDSVFATFGTVPVLIMSSVYTGLRGLVSVANLIVGPLIVLGLALYYKSIESRLPSNFVWNFMDVLASWKYMALYYVTGFAVYAALAPSMKGNGYRPGRLWFYGAMSVFFLAPWYRMGVYSDFTTKVVVPCQVVFIVCLATALRNPEGPAARLRQRLLVGALILGGWAATGVVHRALDTGFSIAPPPIERVQFSADSLNRVSDANTRVYKDAFFWNYLTRPVKYWRTPPNPVTYAYEFTPPSFTIPDWVFFSDEHKAQPDGLVIRTEGNKALLRRYNQILDTDKIGTIEVEHSVVDENGMVPRYSIVFQWASAADIDRMGDKWPFHRWRSTVLFPRPEPQQPISTNPYWRGMQSQFALYFKVDDPDPKKKYTVTLKKLTFYQR